MSMTSSSKGFSGTLPHRVPCELDEREYTHTTKSFQGFSNLTDLAPRSLVGPTSSNRSANEDADCWSSMFAFGMIVDGSSVFSPATTVQLLSRTHMGVMDVKR